jgi:hypothetical protein
MRTFCQRRCATQAHLMISTRGGGIKPIQLHNAPTRFVGILNSERELLSVLEIHRKINHPTHVQLRIF